jgi:hypothetical protein
MPASGRVKRRWCQQLASSVATTTCFHGEYPLGVGKAAIVYDALAQTPFVSLYATASSMEDVAELVARHEVLKQHHGDMIIEVNDARGKTSRRWEPLTFVKCRSALWAWMNFLRRKSPAVMRPKRSLYARTIAFACCTALPPLLPAEVAAPRRVFQIPPRRAGS